jgi:hypothetical protein
MTITFKATRKTKQVLIGIDNLLDRNKKALKDAWFDVGKEVVRETQKILTTGPRTGKWYTYKGKPYQASAEGEAPARRSGKLAFDADYKIKSWQEMTVGESLPYAKMENKEGYGRIKSRPHIIVAVNNKKQETVNIIQDALDREIKR